jgi:transcriptional regulator with XRE-family HTH domain
MLRKKQQLKYILICVIIHSFTGGYMYNLKEYLFYSGLTVGQFSLMTGINRTELSSILTGARRPSKNSMALIVKFTKGKVTQESLNAPIKLPGEWESDEEDEGENAA